MGNFALKQSLQIRLINVLNIESENKYHPMQFCKTCQDLLPGLFVLALFAPKIAFSVTQVLLLLIDSGN